MMTFVRETCALAELAGRAGWDQEVMMPAGAAAQRAEEIAALEGVLHARRTDPRLGEWIATVVPQGAVERASLRELRRRYQRDSRVPADLAVALARVTSQAQRIWAEARAADDMAMFLPTLREVVALRRQEGAAIADGGDPYDALIQDYEPGMSAARLDEIFAALRGPIVDLRARVLDRPAPAPLEGHFPQGAQLALSERLAKTFGYDLDRGRIDLAVHPFCSGSGADVRVTTRVDESDPLGCLFSIIHEVGHACYEQGVDPAYALGPLGGGVSMGVHESQSRIFENQMARSFGFAQALHPMMHDAFGDAGGASPEALWRAVNRVEQGFIRTESDELSYNLHIMMRFDLERDLIRGDLSVEDLEEAWNTRFESDFGLRVPRASLGVLQDVHWPVGLFGYFPTYALGNVYAGCLFDAMGRDLGDLEALLAAGEVAPLRAWLGAHVHCHGGLYEAEDLITRACGAAPDAAPLLRYLEAKFSRLYAL